MPAAWLMRAPMLPDVAAALMTEYYLMIDCIGAGKSATDGSTADMYMDWSHMPTFTYWLLAVRSNNMH